MKRCGAIRSISSVRLELRILICAAGLVSVGATSAVAQDTLTVSADSTARTNASDARPLVSRRDILMLTGAVISTAAIAPFDHNVQRTAYREDLRHRGVQRAAKAFAFTGGPGPFIAGGALYVGGLTAGSQNVAQLGVTLTEGVVVAATLNGVIKGFAGRSMPNVKSGHPGHFSWGRGFHDGNGPFVSFPSGHTAASFAAATVLAEDAKTWGPTASEIVPTAAYTTATLVAVSRLYANVHWASDLPLGAAIGIWSGKTVTTWQRRHPDNWLTRRLLGVGITPQRHGLTITAAMPLEAQ
jgi:membrane-associated phospholipid phosphatase